MVDPKLENEECFKIVSGFIPVYAYESRVEISNDLYHLAIQKKISYQKAWDEFMRKDYQRPSMTVY